MISVLMALNVVTLALIAYVVMTLAVPSIELTTVTACAILAIAIATKVANIIVIKRAQCK